MTVARLAGLLTAFALSLLTGHQTMAAPSGGEDTCGRLVQVLLDDTGSFEQALPPAIQEAKRLLLGLGAGDCFLVRAIRDQSYGANNDIVPLRRFPLTRRTIDAAHRREQHLMKREMAAALDAVVGERRAGATDLWQALYAASFTFRSVDARQPELHIFSDLKDNRRLRPRSLPLRLADVKVRLLVLRGDRDSPEAFEGRIEEWRRVLLDAGTTGLTFAELSRSGQGASMNGRRR